MVSLDILCYFCCCCYIICTLCLISLYFIKCAYFFLIIKDDFLSDTYYVDYLRIGNWSQTPFRNLMIGLTKTKIYTDILVLWVWAKFHELCSDLIKVHTGIWSYEFQIILYEFSPIVKMKTHLPLIYLVYIASTLK